jgi:uncharacterized protein (TIGR02271 family)
VDTRNSEPLPPGAAAFKKDEVVVPVREEEVEIRKRPAVTGEVRVQKERVVEERRASETVRKEDVRVEKEGDARGVVDRDKKTRY